MSDLFNAHCAWLRAGGSADRTVQARAHWLAYAERELPDGLVDVDQAQLTGWFNACTTREVRPWGLATLDKAHYHLRSFFEWGLDPANAINPAEPIFTDSPMVGMRRPKVRQKQPRPVTDAELAVVLAEAREPFRTAAILAVGAGLRAGEAAQVRREHIEEQQVWVENGKGGKSAYAPALPDVWEHVRDFPRGRVIEHVGGRADWNWLSTSAAKHFRKLGLYKVCLHRLRHTYAELLRRAGCDVAVISKALRHEHLSSTEIYFRASEAECRLAVNALRLPVPTPR